MRNPYASVSNPNDFVTCPGERYHVIFSPVVNDDGTINLVETGRDDIQEMIDSYREQTDISFMLAAMAAGDTSVLSSKEPMYGDFTQMPKTYAEALQLVIDAEEKFYTLPLDVRNKFDNDYRQWFAQSGSDEWLDKMSSVIEKSDVNSNDDVKETPTDES